LKDPESSRQATAVGAPVVFQENVAEVLRAAAGGCDEILTVTAASADRCSTYAAAGPAASAHAPAAIAKDRTNAALIDGAHAGRPRSFTEHLDEVGGAAAPLSDIGNLIKKIYMQVFDTETTNHKMTVSWKPG
jgi:hypothetical protein